MAPDRPQAMRSLEKVFHPASDSAVRGGDAEDLAEPIAFTPVATAARASRTPSSTFVAAQGPPLPCLVDGAATGHL